MIEINAERTVSETMRFKRIIVFQWALIAALTLYIVFL